MGRRGPKKDPNALRQVGTALRPDEIARADQERFEGGLSEAVRDAFRFAYQHPEYLDRLRRRRLESSGLHAVGETPSGTPSGTVAALDAYLEARKKVAERMGVTRHTTRNTSRAPRLQTRTQAPHIRRTAP